MAARDRRGDVLQQLAPSQSAIADSVGGLQWAYVTIRTFLVDCSVIEKWLPPS
jgi:hypothetical protein